MDAWVHTWEPRGPDVFQQGLGSVELALVKENVTPVEEEGKRVHGLHHEKKKLSHCYYNIIALLFIPCFISFFMIFSIALRKKNKVSFIRILIFSLLIIYLFLILLLSSPSINQSVEQKESSFSINIISSFGFLLHGPGEFSFWFLVLVRRALPNTKGLPHAGL